MEVGRESGPVPLTLSRPPDREHFELLKVGCNEQQALDLRLEDTRGPKN